MIFVSKAIETSLWRSWTCSWDL